MILLLIGAGLAVGGPVEAGELTSYGESNVGSPSDLKELKHGLVQGYLAPETLLDSLKLLAPPPAPGSGSAGKLVADGRDELDAIYVLQVNG